jgi:heme A synthase
MPLHLVNTALLLACSVIAAESIRFGDLPRTPLPRPLRVAAGIVCAILTLLLTSGAVAALGSHLAPAASVGAGLAADFSATAHPAVRLRILHPILALIGGIALLLPIELLRERTSAPRARRALTQLAITVVIALLVGIGTLLSLAPVWLKLSHLVLANLLVILASVSIFHLTRTADAHRFADSSSTPLPQDKP